MFRINRLKLEIKSRNSNPDNVYGFDIPFDEGLNIIAGENSRGKTTISSSIYYALGMEELLGGINDKALGKALKSNFETYDKNTSKWINHPIAFSKVYIEIVNSDGNICTLKRIINAGSLDAKENSSKTKFINVFESKIEDITSAVKQYPLFLRNNNNNEDDYGFYFWFANFIGFELPIVTNPQNKEGHSPLYLQTIFPALFIEQTKGWSGFLSSIPYFGIPNNKEKSLSFILDLKELYVTSELERLENEEKSLKEEWKKTYNKIEILSAEYNAVIKVPQDIVIDKEDIELSTLHVLDENVKELIPLNTAVEKLELEIKEINAIPLAKVGDVKDALRVKLEGLYVSQTEFMKMYEGFDLKLKLQETQKESIGEQLLSIKAELSRSKGVQNIVEEAIIENVYDNCPTCSQTVSKDLMFEKGVKIETLTLEENIAYLTGQEKIVRNSISSLSKVIDEKKRMRKYYSKKQREIEEEIKITLMELISDDRDYSLTETLKRVRMENKLTDYRILGERFDDYTSYFEDLTEKYKIIIEEKDKANEKFKEDDFTLGDFETIFKKILFYFNYDSNNDNNIYIQKESPFKFFPVYKNYKDDKLPQSIKNNSSASDFVRSIWAYSMALLIKGKNHPGVLILDEPGQHKVSSKSLKNLFTISSRIKKRKESQIIIFTSVDKVLSEVDGDKDVFDINKILESIPEMDYNIYYIEDGSKSINLLA